MTFLIRNVHFINPKVSKTQLVVKTQKLPCHVFFLLLCLCPCHLGTLDRPLAGYWWSTVVGSNTTVDLL